MSKRFKHKAQFRKKDKAILFQSLRKGPRGGVTEPFPKKLYNVLGKEEYSGIISWQPHGKCFILHKPQVFLREIMPRHFRQSKLTSFQRQLNLYGFSRITSGPDKGGYYHELFLRGKENLCENMLRMRIKGTGARSPVNGTHFPDFYSMTILNDTQPTVRIPLEDDASKVDDDISEIRFSTASLEVGGMNSSSSLEDTRLFSVEFTNKAMNIIEDERPEIVTIPPSPAFKVEKCEECLSFPPSMEIPTVLSWDHSPPDLSTLQPSHDEVVIFEGKTFHYIHSLSPSSLFCGHDRKAMPGRLRSITFDASTENLSDFTSVLDCSLSLILPMDGCLEIDRS